MTAEKALLRRAREFEPKALAEIYDCHSPALFRYALRLLGASDLAEECVAESFNRLLEEFRKGKGPTQYLRAYLYRVAYNWIVDQYRRVPLLSQLDSEMIHETAAPHELLEIQADAECVRKALEDLTADQRQVIILKFMEDCTNEEIAMVTHKPIGAVKSLQHRALAALHRRLASEDIR